MPPYLENDGSNAAPALLDNIGAAAKDAANITTNSDKRAYRDMVDVAAPSPKLYGAVGDGVTDDDAAFAALAAANPGAAVDLQGRVHKLSSVPSGIGVYNGDVITPDRAISLPRRRRDHPLEGQVFAGFGDGILRHQIHGLLPSSTSSRIGLIYKASTVHAQTASFDRNLDGAINTDVVDVAGVPTQDSIETPMPSGLDVAFSYDNCNSFQFGKTILTGEGFDITDTAAFVGQGGRWICLSRMKNLNEGNIDATTRRVQGIYRNDVAYSDDQGESWTIIREVLPNAQSLIPYWMAVDTGSHYVVGGYRTECRIAYTSYAQNGIEWSYYDVFTDYDFVEPSICRIGDQQKYVILLRPRAAGGNLWISTSTNPTSAASWTTPVDTGIPLGYNTVFSIYDGGLLYVYMQVRDFEETSVGRQNEKLLIVEEAEYVFANSNFRFGALRQVDDMPDRAHGYGRYIKRGQDFIYAESCWEGGDSTAQPGPSSVFFRTNRVMAGATPYYVHQAGSRPNLLRNGTFQHWSRGTSFPPFTGQTVNKICDGWAVAPSNSTVTVSRTEVPRHVAAIVPFNPRYGLQISATAEDNVALLQDFKRLDAMYALADRMVCWQVFGYGDIPSTPSMSVVFNYDVGDPVRTARDVTSVNVTEGTNGYWRAFGQLQLPRLRDEAIGPNSYARLLFQCSGSAPWNVTMLGIKLEVGQAPSRFDQPDFHDERARCDRFLQVKNFASLDQLGAAGLAPVANNLWTSMSFPPMVRAPGVSFLAGAATDLQVYRHQQDVTGLTFNQIGTDRLQMRASVASGVPQDAPGFLRVKNGNSVSILLDAE